MQWLNTDVIAIGSPSRAESADFVAILDVFGPIQAAFVVEEHLVSYVDIPS